MLYSQLIVTPSTAPSAVDVYSATLYDSYSVFEKTVTKHIRSDYLETAEDIRHTPEYKALYERRESKTACRRHSLHRLKAAAYPAEIPIAAFALNFFGIGVAVVSAEDRKDDMHLVTDDTAFAVHSTPGILTIIQNVLNSALFPVIRIDRSRICSFPFDRVIILCRRHDLFFPQPVCDLIRAETFHSEFEDIPDRFGGGFINIPLRVFLCFLVKSFGSSFPSGIPTH